jgi:hypothetical protein
MTSPATRKRTRTATTTRLRRSEVSRTPVRYDGSMAVVVHINRPPHSARLEAWGCAEDGWWGLMT